MSGAERVRRHRERLEAERRETWHPSQSRDAERFRDWLERSNPEDIAAFAGISLHDGVTLSFDEHLHRVAEDIVEHGKRHDNRAFAPDSERLEEQAQHIADRTKDGVEPELRSFDRDWLRDIAAKIPAVGDFVWSQVREPLRDKVAKLLEPRVLERIAEIKASREA